jgi:CheY-like chemotaxis protein
MPNRPKVLVVDDDPAMREYLGTSLRLGGFDVQMAGDGLAALRRIEDDRPDAVLLDLDLPLMNGFAVHTALQLDERTRRLPIVVVTGTGWNGPSPAAATLIKPVSPDDLVKVMFDALARSQAHDERRDDAQRTVLWLCPECARVARETQETGHPMTSEMRKDSVVCPACAAKGTPEI